MANRSDIEAGRAFVTLFLKDKLLKPLSNLLSQTRAKLQDFAHLTKGVGEAAAKIGVAISAGFIAIASGNALVTQRLGEIHKLLANAIAPAVMPLLDLFKQLAVRFAQWASQNKGLLTTVLKTGIALTIAGGALKLISTLAKAISLALSVIQGTVAAIGALLTTTWIGPLAIFLAGLVAIGALVYRFSATWRTFFQQNMADAAVWAGNMIASVRSIFNAVSSGEFALAWRIAFVAVEIEFKRFFDWLTSGYAAVADKLSTIIKATMEFAGDSFLGPGTAQMLLDTLAVIKDINAENKRGEELTAMKLELENMRRKADAGGIFGAFGVPGNVRSTTSAAGAAALGFGTTVDPVVSRLDKLHGILSAQVKYSMITNKKMDELIEAAKGRLKARFGP